jgi:hypothetical protein
MEKSIVIECFADTALIEELVPPESGGYNHQYSCSKVAGLMETGKLRDGFAVGVIDDDKVKLPYLKSFAPVDKVEDSLNLLKHTNRPHYMIQIRPALERWVLNVFEEAEVQTEWRGRPIEEFKKWTKSKSSKNDPELRKLFKKIGQLSENQSVRKLKGWVKLLRDKNYNVDINELKNV